MFPLLTAPQVQPAQSHRYMVELASDELTLDAQGVPVPKDYQRVDVVVLEPTVDAIKTLIASADWLRGYTVVSHWQPDFDDCF